MRLADEDARLLARSAAWTGEDIDWAELTTRERIDFATALLHERLLRIPTHAEFFRTARDWRRPANLSADLIGIVPGAFHREHRGTGADGARVLAIARELRCEAEVIPTSSFGTLEENGRIILNWLASRRNRRIALVSLSKGGADLKRALALPDEAGAFAPVLAWVSFSGMVQGTPLIDWLRRRPLRWWAIRLLLWWRGCPARTLDQLRHGHGTDLADWPALPKHLRIVQVFGFPLRRHLAHPWARRGYERLSPLGPNDGGGILLGDLPALPGIVCPIWGADHYLSPSWDIQPLLEGIVAAALTK